MSVITMRAESTSLVLNGFAVVDFSEGDFIELAFPNPLTSQVNSADGGVNINQRVDGNVADLTVRVQKFSASDVFLNSSSNQPDPTVLGGSVKEDYTRDGVDGAESYILENGSLTARPSNTKNNQDGNGMMEYVIRFRNASRNI